MGMFADGVNARIRKEGIVVRDAAHYEELYVKFRDDYFLRKHGMTFMEWKVWKDRGNVVLDKVEETWTKKEYKLTTRDKWILGSTSPLWAPLVLIACCGMIALWCLQPRK